MGTRSKNWLRCLLEAILRGGESTIQNDLETARGTKSGKI